MSDYQNFTMENALQSSMNDTKALNDNDRSEPLETIKDAELLHQNVPTISSSTPLAVGSRVRLYSESQVYTVSRWEDTESQDGGSAEEGAGAGDGVPFRGRSQSAPAALWAAKKYGRQLRRMSDEFDTWLDKGELKRVNSPGGRAGQKKATRGWFSFLWSPKEEEGRE
ncbi:uncharacterized protein bada [Chanos chanos]|uniref:Uncharacterized protein bada n=1 Tax=Chanos chanos TaxID=29144 RepID=A0A6J2W688_CHACN|nr:bcl2-associated agonist of cell death [Chanos chanos]